MSINLHLEDNEYPFTGFEHTRNISRGIVLDENGNVAVHHIYRDDVFCNQWYYETPGGGIDEGETPEEAFCRECDEELGCEVEILGEIGVIEDAYNRIKRRNINHYFLGRIVKRKQKHFESRGDLYIKETLYVPIDEAIKLYESQPDNLVSGLVKRRELPILKEAKAMIARK